MLLSTVAFMSKNSGLVKTKPDHKILMKITKKSIDAILLFNLAFDLWYVVIFNTGSVDDFPNKSAKLTNKWKQIKK